MDKGLFIVLEGADDGYTNTQFTLLKKRLQKSGYDVLALQFPRLDESSSYFVKQYLEHEYPEEEVSPYTASVFYALHHYESAARIKDMLSSGGVVLASGYHGATMARMSQKFTRDEERSGYYLWHDSLEFEMLKLPRPTKSLVLQNTSDARQAVYESISHVFPKDFQLIDLIRNHEPIDEAIASDMIWEVIKPMLPYLAETYLPDEISEESIVSVATVVPMIASELLGAEFGKTVQFKPLSSDDVMQDGDDGNKYYRYYIPKGLNDELRTSYIDGMNEIYNTCNELQGLLSDFLQTRSLPQKLSTKRADELARQVLMPVLPLATQRRIATISPSADMRELISLLSGAVLPEAKQLVDQGVDDSTPRNHVLDRMAQTFLKTSYTDHVVALQIKAVLPRNELDIVPAILYPRSNLTLGEIEQAVAAWPYDQKEAVLQAYLQELDPSSSHLDPILSQITYDIEMLCDFGVLRELQQRLAPGMVSWQELTPRYGYDVPHLLEDAGIAERFEDCFDTSLRIHSQLQAGGHAGAAQYATLFGHKLRCNLQISAAEIPLLLSNLHNHSVYIGYKTTMKLLSNKLKTTHPLLFSALTATDTDKATPA